MASQPVSLYAPLSRLDRRTSYFSFQAPFLHLFALAFITMFASWYVTGNPRLWKVEGLASLASLCCLHFAVSFAIVQHLRRVPRTHVFWHNLVAVLISAGGLLVILALTRLYYSRSFLLIVFGLQLLWMTVSAWILSRGHRFRLGIVRGGLADDLLALRGVDWTLMDDASIPDDADGVVLDMHRPLEGPYVQLLAECGMRQIPVYHAALISEMLTGRVSLEHLSRGMVEALSPSPGYRVLKRVFDIGVVVLTLPITLPLSLIVAVAIRRDSPGPVLFRQRRVGRGQVPFEMLKFRTMRHQHTAVTQFATANDSRLTRLGRYLRGYRLDELPQLWNVLKGEMSLIGPRPEQVGFVEKFRETIPYYSYRHLIKPGLSGWAQVHLGYTDSTKATQNKLEYDLYYVKNASLHLDTMILVHTIRTILTRFGAR